MLTLLPAERARFEAKVNRAPGQGPHGDCHEWTAADKVAKGRARRQQQGSRKAKLTPAKAAEIRALRGSRTQRSLAAEYGVSCSVISRVQTGELWRA